MVLMLVLKRSDKQIILKNERESEREKEREKKSTVTQNSNLKKPDRKT